MSSQPLLLAENLVKRYAGMDQPAVKSFDLELHRGEFVGLLGPNGAGKTTTISMLSTLIRPDSGHISISGHNAVSSPQAIRYKLGVVPQELALYSTLTLRENLTFWGRLYGVRGALLKQRIQECCEFVSLTDVLDRTIETFSGGMKRRANLAAGIIHQPDLLFLDEPTVGIDAQSRHQIISNLRHLNRNGMTMVYTTHYMEEVQQLCSRVIIVDGGEVVTQGEVALILTEHECSHLEELFLKLTGNQLRD